MPFASKAQKKFFQAKSKEPGREGKKFKKWTKEFEKETPKDKPLPYKIDANESVKLEHGVKIMVLEKYNSLLSKLINEKKK